MSSEMVDRFREIGLFGGLADDVLESLVTSLNMVDFTPGAVVFREGEPGRDMFLLLSGEMEVLKRSRGGRDARVAMLGPGDWFGEMSILDIMPRSATVRALAPSKMVRLSAQDLDTLYRGNVRAYALIVLNIAREMSRRLRVADGIIAEMMASVADGYRSGS